MIQSTEKNIDLPNRVSLRLVDEAAGSYKWYEIGIDNSDADLFNTISVTIKRGRIGQQGEVLIRKFQSHETAREYMEKKVRDKIRTGYQQYYGNPSNRVDRCQLCKLLDKGEGDSCFVAEFERTLFFLNWDQTYRGRSMLVLKTHVVNFFSLSTSEVLGIVKELRIAERAVSAVLNPDMFNYLFMGNRAGHAHLHLVPRYTDDTNFGNSPFLDTNKAIKPQLGDHEYIALANKIRAALEKAQRN